MGDLRVTDALDLILYEMSMAKGMRLKIFFFLFRSANFYKRGYSRLRWFAFPLYIAYRFYSEIIMQVDLPAEVKIGKGLKLAHGCGIVVHRDAVLGAGCMLRQGVTIGNKIDGSGANTGVPVIKDRVEFGAGSVILGPIIVGENSVIGANAVVVRDVPDRAVVGGIPARIIDVR
jgi:serine acetyltransferase